MRRCPRVRVSDVERYEAYKDSGIEWIGEIPQHWLISKGVRALSVRYGYPFESNRFSNTKGWPLIRIRDVGSKTTESLYDGEFVESARIENGDILVGMDGEYKVARWEGHTALLNQRVCALENSAVLLKDYLLYLMPEALRLINELTYGTTVKHLGAKDLNAMSLICPPIDEQRAIADYLDAKTAKIDALVADCEREVGLLREYRKAVISEAVTKGLDPDAPMKDSGIEWIGEIPERWLVRPSKTLFAEGKELRRPDDEQCTASQKYGIIPQAQYIALENQRMVAADKNLDAWKHVEPGDFVISLRSFQGGLELSSVSGCVTWHYIVLKGSHLVESPYYKYLFKTQKYIESLQRTCTYIRDGQDLRYSNFIQVPLPLPPRNEQVAIGAYLNAKTAEIDSLIEAKQSMADKLREYRKSLISEAVTGKFKVPGV